LRAADAADVALVPGASLEATDVPADYYEVVDGWVLPEAPEAAIAAGKHNHMPIALGTTLDEYAQIVDLLVTGPVDTEAAYEAILESWFGKSAAQQVLAVYPAASYATPRAALVAVISDDLMNCPTRRAARAARVGQTEPVWRYLWTHAPESGPWVQYGAAHGTEVPFVFHTLDDFGPPPDELTLSDSVIGYWTRFAATGDPSGEGAAPWPAYDVASDPYLALDVQAALGAGFRTAECDFWDQSGL
jgi:para-nitrobenzyl esterase